MKQETSKSVLAKMDAELAGAGSGAAKLDVIAAYVRRCQLCDLSRRRRIAVPGEGPSATELCIIGEGPGRDEDETGRPFVGPAGRLLDGFLQEAGLARQALFITNIVKCRAADRVGEKLHNRPPLGREIQACHPYIERQLDVIHPRVILCLGNSAARGMLGGHFAMNAQRGRFFPGPSGSRIIATYHPSFIARWEIPGLASGDLRRMIAADMKKAREALA